MGVCVSAWVAANRTTAAILNIKDLYLEFVYQKISERAWRVGPRLGLRYFLNTVVLHRWPAKGIRWGCSVGTWSLPTCLCPLNTSTLSPFLLPLPLVTCEAGNWTQKCLRKLHHLSPQLKKIPYVTTTIKTSDCWVQMIRM